MKIEAIGDAIDLLGESCVWSEAEAALYWVDVRGRMMRRYRQATGDVASFPVHEMPASLALRASGGVLLAMESGIAAFDPDSGRLEPVATPSEPIPHQRFNDGRCDRQGRFWVGTLNDRDRDATGTLFRLGPKLRLDPVLHPVTIPNSLAWSPDGTTMYFSDTTSREIWAYDFDAPTGTPSRRRVFARVPAPGTPDGSTVDAEGGLWNAEYDGWRVCRYLPDGKLDRVIALPVQRPTCCAFGGPGLRTLFVTTAAQKLSEQERAAQPLAGRLLALDVGIAGLPEPAYLD
jgi:sugar lactone lactonase YvrE